MKALQPDAIHYENAHRNTFIAFLLKHDGHQKSIKSRNFSDFRNVAQFKQPFFVRTDKFNLHEINNLFIFCRLDKRQCPLFCKFRLVKAIHFTHDFHTKRCSPLHHRFFGITAGILSQVPHGFPQFSLQNRWKSRRSLSNAATTINAPESSRKSTPKMQNRSVCRTKYG